MNEPGSLSVLYVLADYPIRSERFIVRELRALRRLGVRIRTLTLKAEAGEDTTDDTVEIELRRPPRWYNPRLWASALGAALARPGTAAKLLALAGKAEAGTRRCRGVRTLRLAVLALHFGSALRNDPPDVVHAHFASMPASLALLLAFYLERPFGMSVHARDLYAEDVDVAWKAGRASHVLTCSETAAEDLCRRLPSDLHGRVETVHHGLDLDVWRPAEAEVDPGVPLILAVGRFEPKKGFEHLLEACALLRDEGFRCRCELIGAGPRSWRCRASSRTTATVTTCPTSSSRRWPASFQLLERGFEGQRLEEPFAPAYSVPRLAQVRRRVGASAAGRPFGVGYIWVPAAIRDSGYRDRSTFGAQRPGQLAARTCQIGGTERCRHPMYLGGSVSDGRDPREPADDDHTGASPNA